MVVKTIHDFSNQTTKHVHMLKWVRRTPNVHFYPSEEPVVAEIK